MKKSLPLLISVLAVTACSGGPSEARYPTGYDRTETGGNIYAGREGVFGKSGLCIGGNAGRSNGQSMETFEAAKISLATAVKAAEAKTGGRAYNAGIDAESVVPRYDVRIRKDDRVLKVLIDGSSGKVISVTRSWVI